CLTPNGQLTELDVPTRQSGLGDVIVDRTGAVWFIELRVNQIGRFAHGRFEEFPVPTPSAGLITLAAAPDGAVWFTELRAGQLGRLRDGRVTEFRIPRDGARPFGVAVDAANNVWYTDLSGWLGVLPAASATSREPTPCHRSVATSRAAFAVKTRPTPTITSARPICTHATQRLVSQ